MRAKFADVVEVLAFCGFVAADMAKKSEDALATKLEILPEILPEKETPPEAMKTLIDAWVGHAKAGGKFDVYKEAAAPVVETASAPEPVKNPEVPVQPPVSAAPAEPVVEPAAAPVAAPAEPVAETPTAAPVASEPVVPVAAPVAEETPAPKKRGRKPKAKPVAVEGEQPAAAEAPKEPKVRKPRAKKEKPADGEQAAEPKVRKPRKPRVKSADDAVNKNAKMRRGELSSMYAAGTMLKEMGLEGGITEAKMARYRQIRGCAAKTQDKWYLTSAWNAVCGFLGAFPSEPEQPAEVPPAPVAAVPVVETAPAPVAETKSAEPAPAAV